MGGYRGYGSSLMPLSGLKNTCSNELGTYKKTLDLCTVVQWRKFVRPHQHQFWDTNIGLLTQPKGNEII